MKTQRYHQKRQALAGKYVLGIDPGKEKHMAVLQNPQGLPQGKPFHFQVTHHGFSHTLWEQLAKRMPACDSDHLVIAVETACNLWKTIAHFLHGQGYTVLLVSPLTTHHARPLDNHDFSRTDPKDAGLIADQAQQGRYDPFEVFEPHIESMHQLSITYDKLRKDKSRARLRLRAFMEQYFPEYLQAFDLETKTSLYLLQRYFLPHHFRALNIQEEAPVIARLSRRQHGTATLQRLQEWAHTSIGVAAQEQEATLRLMLTTWIQQLQLLQTQLQQVEKQLIDLARPQPGFDLLISIPYISDLLAALFIGECRGLERYTHYKQIEKFAGLNLKLCDSGQYSGSRHISHIGNRRLRRIIYQMTVLTVRAVPRVRKRFLQRQLKKKAYRKNIIAASAQLLQLIGALLKESRPYQHRAEEARKLKPLEKKYAQAKKDSSVARKQTKVTPYRKVV
jgi:transposase